MAKIASNENKFKMKWKATQELNKKKREEEIAFKRQVS
jgi:hypothetical protein